MARAVAKSWMKARTCISVPGLLLLAGLELFFLLPQGNGPLRIVPVAGFESGDTSAWSSQVP